MNQRRTYRQFVHKEAVFRICCDKFEAATAEIVRQRQILEDYIAHQGEFHHSLEPVELRWGEPCGRIDGKPRPFPADWLYRGPFVRSEVGSARITLTDGKTARTLDFNDLTITETP